jgi:hypothetical protein
MMFQTQKTYVEVEGILYWVLKIIREDHLPIVETWKEHLQADKVFKQNEAFFFVREVPELEILEFTPNSYDAPSVI